MTILVKNGTVVSPTGAIAADVLIDDERIVALVEPGTTKLGVDLEATADVVIDARDKYVVPGGVDGHTHMQMPFGGTQASDTFETGTRAAAWGGTTTIIDFAIQRTGERVLDGLAAWHEKADGNCAIDYGFHQIIGGVDDESLKAMDELVSATAMVHDEPMADLARLIRHHVGYAVSQRQLVNVYQREDRSLAGPWRRHFNHRRKQYVARWEAIVARCVPGAAPAEVAALTQSILGLIFSIAYWPPHTAEVTGLAELIVAFTSQGLSGIRA